MVNYSITELELLAYFNISQFQDLLPRLDFDYTVEYLAVMYIMKTKN